jgi:Uncharacterized conserved protein
MTSELEKSLINPDLAAPVAPEEPRPMARLRNYFLTGLVVAGPVAITLYLTWSFVTWVDDLVRPFIPVQYRPETYFNVYIPGYGLIIAFFALTFLGFLTANLVGKTLVEFGEKLLHRMPIVRPIYKTMKQIFETLFSKEGSSFRTVALVEFPCARHVVAGVPVAAASAIFRQSCRPGACFGLHALHAQPDHGVFLLCPAQGPDRDRYHGRERDDAADVGGHGAAKRRSAEAACRHGCRRAGRPRVAGLS